MAISRSQLVKELEPGLNALFGLEYNRYENEHAEIYATEASDRAFEEEVMLTGFGSAPVKSEGAAVTFDQASESFTARYTHETIAMAFAITEEAIEDNRPRTTGKFPRREGVKNQIADITKRLREHDLTLEEIKLKEQSEESSNTEMLDNLQLMFENMIKDMRSEFDTKLVAANNEIDKLKKQIVIMRGEAKIQGQQVKVTSKHLGDLADTVDEIVRDINGDVDDTYE